MFQTVFVPFLQTYDILCVNCEMINGTVYSGQWMNFTSSYDDRFT